MSNQHGNIDELLDYLNQLPSLYGDRSYDIRREILKYLSEPVSIADEKKRLYMDSMKSNEKELIYRLGKLDKDGDFKIKRKLKIPGFELSNVSKRKYNLVNTSKTFSNINLNFEEFKSCASIKFLEAIDFLYMRNPNIAHTLALQETYFRNEAINIAFIGCLSDKGFNDPFILFRLKAFGL